ncbi:hypothetical protein EGW08_001365 [Elysia chlorotica]|uniref:Ig-like domain-containing protein n=1 Tax=Elysia chlorotica TaxID=188477 RepID=A0A433UAM7_ELYCH|nr:hypothetical protein EGW08_001365 [Elysia chlorotica]
MVISLVSSWTIVILVCAGSELSSAYYGSSDYGVRNRLSNLDKKMDMLINEVNRLSESTSSAGDKKPSISLLTLVSVERSSSPEGNRFTLTVNSNDKQLYYIVFVENDNIVLASGVESSEGPVTVSFTCDGTCKTRGYVQVLFTNKSKSHDVTLTLNNQGNETRYQDRFTMPQLEVEHSGDLVYYPGRDVRVKISASYGEDKGFSNVQFSPLVGKLGAGQFYIRYERELVKESEKKYFFETQESLVTISTSKANVSGYLQIRVDFTDSDADLVKEIEVQKSIILRPRNQEGPYPVDYIKFKGIDGPYRHVNCEIGTSCTLSCSAVGNIVHMQVNRSPVKWEEMLRNLEPEEIDWEPVQDVSEMIFDYSRTVKWTLQATPDSPDLMFQCVAFTDTANATLLKEVVLFSEDLFIDRNRSGIDVESDETNPGMRNVTVTCTIMGRPAHHAYLELHFSSGMNRHASVITESISALESVASTTMEIHESDGFNGATCYSHSMYRHDQYHMDWP